MRVALNRLLRLVPGVAIAAALTFPATASAAVTSLQVLSPGELVAKGAEVDLTISFTCTAGDTLVPPMGASSGLTAFVQQAVSKTQQAFGFGAGPNVGTCTGSPQTAVVPVLASVATFGSAGSPPFRVGPALASIGLNECGPAGCSSAGTGPTAIRISN